MLAFQNSQVNLITRRCQQYIAELGERTEKQRAAHSPSARDLRTAQHAARTAARTAPPRTAALRLQRAAPPPAARREGGKLWGSGVKGAARGGCGHRAVVRGTEGSELWEIRGWKGRV